MLMLTMAIYTFLDGKPDAEQDNADYDDGDADAADDDNAADGRLC